jgi:hypothetical protein
LAYSIELKVQLIYFPFVLELAPSVRELLFTLRTKGHVSRTAFGRFVLKMSEIRFQSLL